MGWQEGGRRDRGRRCERQIGSGIRHLADRGRRVAEEKVCDLTKGASEWVRASKGAPSTVREVCVRWATVTSDFFCRPSSTSQSTHRTPKTA